MECASMTKRAIKALEAALQLLAFVQDADAILPGDTPQPDFVEMFEQLHIGLASLKQRPLEISSMDLFLRLRAAVGEAGSEAELARRIKITRQALSDVMRSRKEPGPAILSYLGLRRVTAVHYTPDDRPKPEPKPRSERRQRAFDNLPPLLRGEGAGAAP
jgi:hypothetical protein